MKFVKVAVILFLIGVVIEGVAADPVTRRRRRKGKKPKIGYGKKPLPATDAPTTIAPVENPPTDAPTTVAPIVNPPTDAPTIAPIENPQKPDTPGKDPQRPVNPHAGGAPGGLPGQRVEETTTERPIESTTEEITERPIEPTEEITDIPVMPIDPIATESPASEEHTDPSSPASEEHTDPSSEPSPSSEEHTDPSIEPSPVESSPSSEQPSFSAPSEEPSPTVETTIAPTTEQPPVEETDSPSEEPSPTVETTIAPTTEQPPEETVPPSEEPSPTTEVPVEPTPSVGPSSSNPSSEESTPPSCPSKDDCDICEDEYVYHCLADWVNYEMDDAPATQGLLAGEYLGQPVFIGRGIVDGFVGAGRIQISEPKGGYGAFAGSEVYISDSSRVWYLKNNDHYLFKWVVSGNGSKVPYAVEVDSCDANDGFVKYVGKIDLGESITVGTVAVASGYAYYTDLNKNMKKTNEYAVLTCRSKVYHPDPVCPVEEPPQVTGCIHEWKPFIGDDAPAVDGVSAGLYDENTEAYVGIAYNGFYMKVGRIEVNNVGVYTTAQRENFLATVNAGYLVRRPEYNYRWVDSSIGTIVPNAVTIRNTEGGFYYVGRSQVNGRMQIGAVFILSGFNYPGDDGWKHYLNEYQVLVCDPEPSCPCAVNWVPYENDFAPKTDGISIGPSTDGSIAYVGSAQQKLPEGSSMVIGRVNLTDGIHYLNDPSGQEELDEEGKYLQRNENSAYAWVTTHTDQVVENAVTVQVRCENSTACDVECDTDSRLGYIGKATIDGVNYVGTVYKNEGLVIADSCGNKMTLSNFEVLTCVSAGRCEEKENNCGETPCGWQED